MGPLRCLEVGAILVEPRLLMDRKRVGPTQLESVWQRHRRSMGGGLSDERYLTSSSELVHPRAVHDCSLSQHLGRKTVEAEVALGTFC